MEVWDAYNKEFEKIKGMTLIRGEAIPDGFYHLVSDIIVKHIDGTYLLMQRDSRKHFGGMWEATAGGSALKGETPLACAVRELWEETGVESEELAEVGRVVSHDTIYVEFLCVTDCDKTSIALQEGETSAYKWVTKDELISMKKEELVTERMQKFIDELKPSDISYVFGNIKFNYRVCGIMIHDGKILAMHDERSPYYYLPGGRVKMSETAECAIVREIEEELGITPRIISFRAASLAAPDRLPAPICSMVSLSCGRITTAAKRSGAMMPANLLHTPTTLMRRAETGSFEV